MDGYQTGAPELMQAAKDLENGNQDLMQQLSQLASSIDAVGGQWEGAAASAFRNLTTRFQEDATTLNNKLLDISEAVTGSATEYQAQEDAANESLSQITTSLG